MTRKSYRVTFPGGAGDDLAGIIDRAEDESERGVLVFSHCFTCNKDLKAIVRISRRMAELGVSVLRYDMTGLGGSNGDFSRTSFSTNLADLCAAARFASQEIGPVTALMGHSFGGAASLAIAGGREDSKPAEQDAGWLDALRCVITLAAPSDTTHLAQLLVGMNPAIETEGVGVVSIGGFDWTIRREMLEDFRRHDLPRWISRIRLPLLLFHSPVDRTVGFDEALRIMTLQSSAPDAVHSASLTVLDGADHLLSQSPHDIEYVARVAAAFVTRHAEIPRGATGG